MLCHSISAICPWGTPGQPLSCALIFPMPLGTPGTCREGAADGEKGRSLLRRGSAVFVPLLEETCPVALLIHFQGQNLPPLAVVCTGGVGSSLLLPPSSASLCFGMVSGGVWSSVLFRATIWMSRMDSRTFPVRNPFKQRDEMKGGSSLQTLLSPCFIHQLLPHCKPADSSGARSIQHR